MKSPERIFIGHEQGGLEIKPAIEVEPREQKESESPFHFRMLYSAHESAEASWSVEELEKELQDVDIWLPEDVGWTEEHGIILRAYATGKNEVPEDMDPYMATYLEALRRVGKAGKEVEIGFVDFPEGHPLIGRLKSDPEKAFTDFNNGRFESAIREMKSSTKKNASAEKSRERYMQENAKPEIDRILSVNSHLREKFKKEGKLTILMTLGTFHTGLARDLQEEGHSVERKFNHDLPFIFPPFHENVRRYRFGKEVSDQLAAQALLFAAILPPLAFLDITKMEQVAGKIVRAMSLEDIRNVSTKLGSRLSIREAMARVGVSIPSSEAEADEELSK